MIVVFSDIVVALATGDLLVSLTLLKDQVLSLKVDIHIV